MFKRNANRLGAVAGLLTLAGIHAQPANAAGSVTGALTVQVALSPVCGVSGGGATLDFLNYVPMQSAALGASTTMVFLCAKGVSAQSWTINGTSSNTYTSTTATRIKGLDYTLTVALGSSASMAAGGGGGVGGTNWTAAINGSIPGSQYGDNTAAASQAHTIYLNY